MATANHGLQCRWKNTHPQLNSRTTLPQTEHFCQVHAVYTPEAHSTSTQLPVSTPPKPPVHQPSTKHSVNVTLDPNNLLPQYVRATFMSLLNEYDHIFDPNIKGYNGAEGRLMSDIDSTLRLIAHWTHVIATDLTSAFYQIPVSRDSMKYCGVATPFRCVRVYARSAMGMPGSEKALEELMSRVLGDLLKDGIVTKIADDLYCDGNSPGELLSNWKKVLQALHKCHLRLSAPKTIINPQSTTRLGWVWNLAL